MTEPTDADVLNLLIEGGATPQQIEDVKRLWACMAEYDRLTAALEEFDRLNQNTKGTDAQGQDPRTAGTRRRRARGPTAPR